MLAGVGGEVRVGAAGELLAGAKPKGVAVGVGKLGGQGWASQAVVNSRQTQSIQRFDDSGR